MDIEIYGKNISLPLWNELLNRGTKDIHNLYQTFEWGSLMESCYHASPKFAVLYDKSDVCGGYLYFKKPVLGIFTGIESFGGPISIDHFVDKRDNPIATKVIQHLAFEGRHSAYISIRPFISSNFDNRLQENGFANSKFYTINLNLDKDLNLLWEHMHKNARNGIRKAKKSDIRVGIATSWKEWAEFHSLYLDHSRNRGIAYKKIEFFDYLFKHFIPKNMVKLFLTFHGDIIVGGMLFLCYDNIMIYYIGASLDECSHNSANDLIMWEAITWGNKNGFRVLDLGDTWPEPNSHLFGIHKFKEKWGGELIRRDFYIKGCLYHFGRRLVLNNNYIQIQYEKLHQKGII